MYFRILYRTQVCLGSDLWVQVSLADFTFGANLTDVTLADEDINSVLTDIANRAFQGNVAMQVTQVAPCGGQIWNLSRWRHLVGNFATNASGAIWWPKLELMQVAQSGGQICN